MSVNKGKNWSKKDETTLVKLLANNKSYREISSSLKRTVGAVKTRRNKIAYDLFLEGQEEMEDIDTLLDKICRNTRLTIPELENIIQKNNTIVSDSCGDNSNINTHTVVTENKSYTSEIEFLKNEIMSLKKTLETLETRITHVQHERFSYPRVVFSGIASQLIATSLEQKKDEPHHEIPDTIGN